MGSSATLLHIIKIVIQIYDILTSWIYTILTKPTLKAKRFTRTRATPTSPIRDGDTQVTYKPVMPDFKSPIIHNFEAAGNRTMAEVFSWSVSRYGPRKFLGTRDILGEDDEIQPNGRIFAKLELGEYRLFHYTYCHVFVNYHCSLDG